MILGFFELTLQFLLKYLTPRPTPWKIVTSFMDALLVNVKKPINILTGLDYWLDNLMCQVPEVLMCFHDEGIVKK